MQICRDSRAFPWFSDVDSTRDHSHKPPPTGFQKQTLPHDKKKIERNLQKALGFWARWENSKTLENGEAGEDFGEPAFVLYIGKIGEDDFGRRARLNVLRPRLARKGLDAPKVGKPKTVKIRWFDQKEWS